MSFESVLQQSIDLHVELCKSRLEKGFTVVEVDVPVEFAPRVFAKFSTELGTGGRLPDWEFGIFSTGEHEGSYSIPLTIDEMEYRRFFLKYTLKDKLVSL